MSASRRTIPILPIPSLAGVEAAHKVQARATQGRFTRWRWASLLAALLVELAQYGVLWLLLGAGAGWQWLPGLALFGVVRVAITGLIGLMIVYAVLSWVQTRSPISDVIARLCEPLLRPVRRVLPLLGGIDLSPLVALVVLQVLMIVLGHLQAGVMQ